MSEPPSTATSRGVLNWPFALPSVPKLKSGWHTAGGIGQVLGVKTDTRLYPVSATTSRLLCASQIRPLGYIAASDAPASVFRKVTVVVVAAGADPDAAAGIASVPVATTSSAPARSDVYAPFIGSSPSLI